MSDVTELEEHWRILDTRTVYRGRTTLVRHDVVLPSGQRLDFEVDESVPFAVACLIVVAGRVLLTRQYRHPIGRWIFDLPAGAGLVGEEPIAAARREVEEELGVIPEDLIPLHTYFSNPGRSAWPVHIFFGSAVSSGTAERDDPAEQVRSASMPLEDLDHLIRAGEIVDPTLLIARSMAVVRGMLSQ